MKMNILVFLPTALLTFILSCFCQFLFFPFDRLRLSRFRRCHGNARGNVVGILSNASGNVAEEC
jgi:hypothetical protein